MNFSFVKITDLKPGDIVHRTTGLWKVIRIEPSDLSEDAWPRVVMEWLKYPGHLDYDVCHPTDCEFLRKDADVPEEDDSEIVGRSLKDYLEDEHYKALGE